MQEVSGSGFRGNTSSRRWGLKHRDILSVSVDMDGVASDFEFAGFEAREERGLLLNVAFTSLRDRLALDIEPGWKS
jgi:hypothetical protein